ncbi:hypothetical protein COT07_00540 [Candidatus Woesearchaeota archaeon CG07_land_8_20_14_0_80_44_23]|nr:MAG: hypothetical protein COT07_00540 [Candidatus Woesearchaeota archaeon CG07_land_8_20_14_0_80_44_23]
MRRENVILALIVFAIMLSGSALALTPNYVIANSEDWRDVYSTVIYANLIKADNGFLTSSKAGTLLLNTIDAKNKNIQIISSSKVPYIVGYKTIVAARGFNTEELTFSDVNLELAKQLSSITKFIIIDDSYGYNAISVAPYAVLDNWYVLFANSKNIGKIDAFLSSRKVDKIIIYGNVNRAVISTLQRYNPEIINKEGDRFENNIEMVKKYRAISSAQQVIFTNGEFIEKEIMSGAEPVIFIGSNNVPQTVREYIKGSGISVAVLIGNELVGSATTIRRELGLSVFVKFAQGARNPQGAISQVEGLDLFYLPKYSLNIEIFQITYNQATQQLEVTYTNTENQAAYIKGTISVTDSSGNSITVGDTDAVFIDGNSKKTIVYSINERLQGNITAKVYTLYGESKNSLEKILQATVQISTIEVMDNSAINITGLEYNSRLGAFIIEVKNVGQVKAYVSLELPDVIVNGIPTTLALKDVASLLPGETRKLQVDVPGKLTEGDIADNPQITVNAYYGERQDSLVKFTTATFPMKQAGFDYVYYATTYGITAAIIFVLILIIIAFFRRRKKKEEQYY